MSTPPTPSQKRTFLEVFSDDYFPFILGLIVALFSMFITMFTIKILIVTKIIYPNA